MESEFGRARVFLSGIVSRFLSGDGNALNDLGDALVATNFPMFFSDMAVRLCRDGFLEALCGFLGDADPLADPPVQMAITILMYLSEACDTSDYCTPILGRLIELALCDDEELPVLVILCLGNIANWRTGRRDECDWGAADDMIQLLESEGFFEGYARTPERLAGVARLLRLSWRGQEPDTFLGRVDQIMEDGLYIAECESIRALRAFIEGSRDNLYRCLAHGVLLRVLALLLPSADAREAVTALDFLAEAMPMIGDDAPMLVALVEKGVTNRLFEAIRGGVAVVRPGCIDLLGALVVRPGEIPSCEIVQEFCQCAGEGDFSTTKAGPSPRKAPASPLATSRCLCPRNKSSSIRQANAKTPSQRRPGSLAQRPSAMPVVEVVHLAPAIHQQRADVRRHKNAEALVRVERMLEGAQQKRGCPRDP
jgi:hypothetical protein